MKKICIQAGHENVKYNSIVALRGSTGAPNEMSFNVDIRDKVSDELRKRGFEVQGVDANANDNPAIIGVDWDLFLSIHYDADVYTTEPKNGGFADYPEPSSDYSTTESQRIVGILNKTYFETTKIPCVTRRSNKNTRYYYMWKYLSKKTPCALLECGVGMHTPEDHLTLHFNRPLVVEGIVRSICEAFDVPYEEQEPVNPCQVQLDKITEMDKKINDLNKYIAQRDLKIEELNGMIKKLEEAGTASPELPSPELDVNWGALIAEIKKINKDGVKIQK